MVCAEIVDLIGEGDRAKLRAALAATKDAETAVLLMHALPSFSEARPVCCRAGRRRLRGSRGHAGTDPALYLAWCAAQGHLDAIRELVDRGVDPHANSEEALYAAIAASRVDVVAHLLAAGADPHATAPRRHRMLTEAAVRLNDLDDAWKRNRAEHILSMLVAGATEDERADALLHAAKAGARHATDLLADRAQWQVYEE